jgi:hypothetical protein
MRARSALVIDIECADIFLQIFAPLCAGNWDDVVASGHYPGERELRRRAPFLVSNFADSRPDRDCAENYRPEITVLCASSRPLANLRAF